MDLLFVDNVLSINASLCKLKSLFIVSEKGPHYKLLRTIGKLCNLISTFVVHGKGQIHKMLRVDANLWMLISMFIFKFFSKSMKVWSLTKTKNIFLCCNPCVLFDEFMIGSLSMKSVFKKELCKFISGVREMYARVRISKHHMQKIISTTSIQKFQNTPPMHQINHKKGSGYV